MRWRLGDLVAQGLGVNLLRTRLLGLLATALLCGASVAVAGPIGFIGLLVPHLIRRLATDDLRYSALLAVRRGAAVTSGRYSCAHASGAAGAGDGRV